MVRILAVDDEPHVTHLMQKWLVQNGHDVTCADNGRIAREHLQNEDFEILITDVTMSDVDGLELIASLQGSRLPLGVVVLTARHDHEQLGTEHQDRHIRFLPKPFSPRLLVAQIDELIEHAQVPAQR